MNDQSAKARRGYDTLAPWYRLLEYSLFGNSLYRSRIALLDQLPRIERALILGDGDGRLLEQIRLAQPDCRLTSVDFSGNMLGRQRQRLTRNGGTRGFELVHKDARSFQPEAGSYDLLVAAFFLDCFDESDLNACLPRWFSSLRRGGHFYFVDFVEPSSRGRRLQSRAYQWVMHRFFRAVTHLPNRKLIELNPFLDRQDLTLVVQANQVHPMMTTRLYQYLPMTASTVPGREA